MNYTIFTIASDGSKTVVQQYDSSSYNFSQVYSIMQGLDQSQNYDIEYFDGLNYSIVFPISSSSMAPPPLPNSVKYTNIVLSAITFGQQLMVKFAVQNILSGITQAGKTYSMLTYTDTLAQCLNTGSLYCAIDVINSMIADTSETKMNLSPFLTDDIITSYKYQIQNYLGLPNQ